MHDNQCGTAILSSLNRGDFFISGGKEHATKTREEIY